MTDHLLTSKQVAQYLSITVPGLAKLRQQQRGPRYLRLTNRLIRYRLADVDAYLTARTIEQTEQEPQA